MAPGCTGPDQAKAWLESEFLESRIKVLVATTALGMGFDKPDLGFVVHYQSPGSVIAYYQQVGRAGRAIPSANAVLLSGPEDERILAYFRDSAFPTQKELDAILAALAMAPEGGLDVKHLASTLNLSLRQIERALKFMSVENPAPVILFNTRWSRTSVSWVLDRERVEWLTRQRELEYAQMQEYMRTPECRMVFLGRALDDPHMQPCGRCDNCTGRKEVAGEVPQELVALAARRSRQSEEPITCLKQVPAGTFPDRPKLHNIPKELQPREGRVLSRWQDGGWGDWVADDKQSGHFRDELVDAVAEMIQTRWKPNPAPCWVTCVPSSRHPALVPDFARRLAYRLGLEFRDSVRKVQEHEPQKLQRNRVHQLRNLIGVFKVLKSVLPGPVLLVDDMVDSTATFAVVAKQLSLAGGGPVYPVALASTRMRAE